MAARPTTSRRSPAQKRAAPATKAPTMADVASEIAARMPVVTGLKAKLEEIAHATGAYLRTLREAGVPEDMAREFVGNWQASLWPVAEADEHFEDADPELA